MRLRRLTATVAGCGLLAVAAGCGQDEPDLVAGKQLFVEKCGSCHVLARAETQGTQGPNLDAAFREALNDGFGRGGVEGAVLEQIKHPADLPEDHPVYMPPDLVTGEDARDVAAYVAQAVARPGEDTGVLAEVGQQGPTEVEDPEKLVASGDPQRGAEVFSESCASCHGDDGGGGSGPALAGNAQLDAEGVVNQILEGGGAMPPFAGRLSEEDLAAVSAYVMQLAER